MPGRTRARASTAVAAGALLLVSGCGLFGGSDDDADRSTTSRRASTTTTTTAPSQPEVVDTGAEPRRPLRFALEEGSTTVATVTTDLELAQADAARPHTVDPPPVVQTVRIDVGDVDETGADLTLEVTAVEVAASGTDLTADEVAAIDEDLQDLTGTTGSARLTPQGTLEDVEIAPPDGAGTEAGAQARELTRSLTSLVPRLPSEPIGPGASWTVSQDVQLGGVRSHQVTTYEVTAIEGTTVTYRSRTRATAPHQPISEDQLGDLPDGTTAELATATYEGEGRGTLRLDLPASEAQGSVEGTQTVVVRADGDEERRLEQVVRMAARVRLA